MISNYPKQVYLTNEFIWLAYRTSASNQEFILYDRASSAIRLAAMPTSAMSRPRPLPAFAAGASVPLQRANPKQGVAKRKWRGTTSPALCSYGPQQRSPAFAAAIASGRVLDRGVSVRVDKDGLIDTASLPPRSVDTAWRAAVDAAVALIVDAAETPADVISVCCRGSVVSGAAIPGISDIDLVAYVRPNALAAVRDARSVISAAVCDRFAHLVARVDCLVFPLDGGDLPYATILQAFGVCVHGQDLVNQLPPRRVSAPRAADVQRDRRVTLQHARQQHSLDAERRAYQWFLKRSLRTCTELCCRDVGRYARDLVPCRAICIRALASRRNGPCWEELLTEAVQLACDCGIEIDSLHDASATAWRARVLSCIDGMTAIVEDMYLNANFPAVDAEALLTGAIPANLFPAQRCPKPLQSISSFVQDCKDVAADLLVCLPSSVTRATYLPSPVRDELPPIPELPVSPCVSLDARLSPVEVCLQAVSKPILFQGLVQSVLNNPRRARYSRKRLASTHHRLFDVRVSPSNIFTFCRSTHSLVTNGHFTPPSKIIRMPGSEFVVRSSASEEGTTERVYMQTTARPSERIIAPISGSVVCAAQDERVWVSTYGTVSSLHYDASYSVLAQVEGVKRIIFFPASCLCLLGIYPLGHPLHRRSRIDLSAGSTSVAGCSLFAEFWRAVLNDGIAVEAVLNPGDVITFPPGWAHYTTTNSSWAVSHTFRF
jgi:Cupin-like domain